MELSYETFNPGQNLKNKDEILSLIKEGLGEVRYNDALNGINENQLGFVVCYNTIQRTYNNKIVVGVAGFGKMLMHRDSWYLAFNVVDKEYRFQGIGNALNDIRLNHLLENMKAEYVWVSSKDNWKRMEKFGFKELEMLTNGNDNHCVMIYKK
jgi:ribosomal protein S18 acetylase RimI-like enzyme